MVDVLRGVEVWVCVVGDVEIVVAVGRVVSVLCVKSISEKRSLAVGISTVDEVEPEYVRCFLDLTPLGALASVTALNINTNVIPLGYSPTRLSFFQAINTP